jgi:hypothetical protein
MSRFGTVRPQDIADLEVALQAAVSLADESRCGWGLRERDQMVLSLALAAERAASAEAELESVKKELIGARLAAARAKKKAEADDT